MQYRKLAELKKLDRNPRTIKEDDMARLVESLRKNKDYFEARPLILSNRTGELIIIAGNQRYEAAKILGMDEVPTFLIEGLTEAREREIIIRDNVANGQWDYSELANSWDEKDLLDWGVPVWDTEDLEDENEGEAKEDDYDIPDEVHTDIVRGDLFEIGPHRLLCGDATDKDAWGQLMPGEEADLVITDPPYNVDYTGKTKDALKIENDKKNDADFYEFLLKFYRSLAMFTKRGGVWYVWHADSEGENFRRAMAAAGIPVRQCLIWVKNSLVMGRQDYHWQHEPCLYGWKEGAAHGWYSDRKQTTLLYFDRPSRNAEHPTMKPVPLISYQMTNSSKQGDIVADGFGGSGTTMVAAHQIGRKCRMMELDPKYCQVIIDRMRKLDPDIKIIKNGKQA